MAWEHALLGDLDPDLVQAAAAGDRRPVDGYRDLLGELGRAPRRVDEARLRGSHPRVETVRLPGSRLVLTVGELNVLPDYLGRPEEIEAAPLAFIGPLIQSVRSWSVAELGRSAGHRSPLAGSLPRPPRLLPGALRYPLLGPLAETAEIAAVSTLGRRLGFAPTSWYASVLARNACHFAPFSWYRWHSSHLMARALIARSASAHGAEREALRLRARIYAGYADHFLQDSFAAGHLINKTLVIQWYIEWLAASGVSYPHRDVLDALTVARQPLLHGPGHYDRAAARLLAAFLAGRLTGGRPAGRGGAGAAVGPAGRGRRSDAGGADRGQRRDRRHRRRAARRVRGLPGDARQRHRAAGREGRARVPQQALARRLLPGRTARASGCTGTTPCSRAPRERCERRRRPPCPVGRSRSCCGTVRPRSTAGTSSTASPTTSSRTAGWSPCRSGTAAGCVTCASNCSRSGRRARCGSSCPAPSGSWAGLSTPPRVISG